MCKRQALYDSAVGARRVHELRSYVDAETLHDNNAYTITSTYLGRTGNLTIYSTHPTPSNDLQNPIEYRMTQLNGWKMTGNPEALRQGASALRNARDLVKEKREEFIAAANAKALIAEHSGLDSSTQSFASLSSDEPVHLESETSAEKLALGIDAFATFIKKTSIRIRTNYPLKVSSNRRLQKSR